MKKLLNTVDSLCSEKKMFIETVRKMAKEIRSIIFRLIIILVFEIIFVPRLNTRNLFLDNKQKHYVNKKEYSKFKTQMKKDLNDHKKHLYSLKSNISFMFL
jgi:hypothetical protein